MGQLDLGLPSSQKLGGRVYSRATPGTFSTPRMRILHHGQRAMIAAPVCWVVLGEPFECVQAAEPDRGSIVTELLDSLGV